ncbi:hypothetical protein M6B38_377090 [Iris pallida]|uniref:Uncharacterized protein n=1 Tax=Iris pallida TaxID=29817 RepID=A0AAX6GAT0_IRIPA|nr:hypothetical protein M6B38_377090 [Iris pallida]
MPLSSSSQRSTKLGNAKASSSRKRAAPGSSPADEDNPPQDMALGVGILRRSRKRPAETALRECFRLRKVLRAATHPRRLVILTINKEWADEVEELAAGASGDCRPAEGHNIFQGRASASSEVPPHPSSPGPSSIVNPIEAYMDEQEDECLVRRRSTLSPPAVEVEGASKWWLPMHLLKRRWSLRSPPESPRT